MIINIIFTAAIIIAIIFASFIAFFNRNPKREITKGKNIVSPADGRIIAIREINGDYLVRKGLLGRVKLRVKEKMNLVSIFMSPLDVHINRIPYDGKIKSTQHYSGKFLPVQHFENAFRNEKQVTILSTRLGDIIIIQVAGFFARRIICNATTGKHFNKGDVFGRITLGSQCIILLPKNLKIVVKEKQHVKAGISVLAK